MPLSETLKKLGDLFLRSTFLISFSVYLLATITDIYIPLPTLQLFFFTLFLGLILYVNNLSSIIKLDALLGVTRYFINVILFIALVTLVSTSFWNIDLIPFFHGVNLYLITNYSIATLYLSIIFLILNSRKNTLITIKTNTGNFSPPLNAPQRNRWGLKSAKHIFDHISEMSWVAPIIIILLGIIIRLCTLDAPIQTYHDVYAALGSKTYGIPQMDSGVIYLRAVIYSYYLAGFMHLQELLFTNFEVSTLLRLGNILLACGTMLFSWGIIKQFPIPTRWQLFILLITVLSTWSITYDSFYIRFFAALTFFMTGAIYFFTKFQKTELNRYLLLFVVFAVFAVSIEKPAFVLTGLPVAYLGLIVIFRKFSKKHFAVICAVLVLMVSMGISAYFSSPILPDFFQEHAQTISEKKADIVSNLDFKDYYLRVLNNWYPGYLILLAGLVFPLVAFRNYKHLHRNVFLFMLVISSAIILLSFSGTSKLVPRNMSFLNYSFAMILGLSAYSFSVAYKSKLVTFSASALALLLLTQHLSFFTTPIHEGKIIPYSPIRVSSSDAFSKIHDMSLAANTIKDYMNAYPETLLISTHSAAWENIHLSPYKITYVYNTNAPENRLTTAYKANGQLYSLYRGIQILTSEQTLEDILNQHNRVLVITNYDFQYRLIEQDQMFFNHNKESIIFQKLDSSVKVYEFLNYSPSADTPINS